MANITRLYRSLAEALDAEYRTDKLKELATLICPVVPAKKGDRIAAIVATVAKDLQAVFDRLSPLARNAVAETVHTWSGFFEREMFVAKYSMSPWAVDQDPGRYASGKGDLLDLFLIADHMPGDLFQKLREIVPLPPAERIGYAETGPGEECTVRETCRAALADMAMILSLTAGKKVRVSEKTGRPTKSTVKTIGELLFAGDWYEDEEIEPMQPFAWPLLLQVGGLAKADGPVLTVTPAGAKAWKNNPAEAIKKVWNKWEKTTLIDEFSRVTAIKGQQSSGGRTMTSPAKRRPMINLLLKNLEPGKWIAIDELSRLLRTRVEYTFSMVNYEWKLYFAEHYYGHLESSDNWDLLQLRYLLIYLFEYCATLGMVDVAYTEPHGARDDFTSHWGADDLSFLSHCDGLQYIRINALGAYVLGQTAAFSLPREAQAIYAFEGRDIVFVGGGPISPGQAFSLDKIAGRLEVDRWRLSVSSLLQAIDAGETLAGIQKALAEASATGFGEEIDKLFREVEQRSTALVEVGRATLIECSTEMRKHVLTDARLGRLCLPVGDSYVAIVPGKEEQFAEAIKALGFRIASL